MRELLAPFLRRFSRRNNRPLTVTASRLQLAFGCRLRPKGGKNGKLFCENNRYIRFKNCFVVSNSMCRYIGNQKEEAHFIRSRGNSNKTFIIRIDPHRISHYNTGEFRLFPSRYN